jgi:hypothetical protein
VGEQCYARTPDENAIWRGEVNRKGVTGDALRRDAPPDMSIEASPPTFTLKTKNKKQKGEVIG